MLAKDFYLIISSEESTTNDIYCRYLMETWWRGINKSDLFNAFLRDIAEDFVI